MPRYAMRLLFMLVIADYAAAAVACYAYAAR